MNLNKVKEFIQLAKDEGVSSLKYEEKDLKISVELGTVAKVISQPQVIESRTSSMTSASNEQVSEDPSLHTITSPFVGTFYASPSPGAASFVTSGKKVNKGDTLCILEAMKIMNEIESDISGEVVEVCVENESLVEFGQPLFRIRA
jgi:acetyl-CoA carboxylase biotin carboxyl carrier protein